MELTSDEFWRNAFRSDDPLRPSYQAEFRRGIIEVRESDLGWARLAIYAVTDSALLQIVGRLVSLAIEMPAAEFVESLCFFVMDPSTLARLRARVLLAPDSIPIQLSEDIDKLRATLKARGDSDLADSLDTMANMLRNVHSESS